MKSIVEMNKLPRDRFMGWQTRLDEVRTADSARAKFLAWHHIQQALVRAIPSITEALETYKSFMKLSEAERRAIGKKQARDIADAVFRSFLIMDRIEPGIAAVEKLAGGDLPPNLRAMRQQIWRTLQKADAVRQKFYAGYCPDLPDAIGPLCDELENLIIALYGLSKGLCTLRELNGSIQ